MKITYKTRTSEVLPLLMTHPDRVEWLLEQVPEVEFKSVVSMTITEFADLTDDEAAYIEKHIFCEKRALNALGKLKHLKKQMENLSSYLKSLNIDQTPEEKQAHKGVKTPTFIQSVLLDLVDFFHLDSFDEAEKKTIGNWLLIFQQKAAQAKIERNLQKIWSAKNKTKPKH